jgi:hypothetical protein
MSKDRSLSFLGNAMGITNQTASSAQNKTCGSKTLKKNLSFLGSGSQTNNVSTNSYGNSSKAKPSHNQSMH